MGFDNNDRHNDVVYSQKIKAGKRRTYFFDVRRTRSDDYFVSITESSRRFEEGGAIRQKILLYKEDFNRFINALIDVVEHVKTELLPDYDYDEFTRRHERYEQERNEAEGDDYQSPDDAEGRD